MNAQAMDQRIQKLLLADTVDFDIQNCMPVLLAQMVERLGLEQQVLWSEAIVTLKKLAYSRQEFCERDLGVSVAEGKRMVHEMLMGGSVPTMLQNVPAATAVVALARFLRWWACSAAPAIYDALREAQAGEFKKWPEASTVAHLWQGVEDHILEVMCEYACSAATRHVSLHFDGLRVDRARVALEPGDGTCIANTCAHLAARVKEQTGYSVVLVAKEHLTFVEALDAEPAPSREPAAPESMLDSANCIPLALATVTKEENRWHLFAAEGAGAGARTRAYRDVAADFGVRLEPALSMDDLRPGCWLVHSDNQGMPHCVGLDFQSSDVCILHWKGKQSEMTARALRGLLVSAIDQKTFVFFYVCLSNDDPGHVAVHLTPLLDLLTGTGAA